MSIPAYVGRINLQWGGTLKQLETKTNKRALAGKMADH